MNAHQRKKALAAKHMALPEGARIVVTAGRQDGMRWDGSASATLRRHYSSWPHWCTVRYDSGQCAWVPLKYVKLANPLDARIRPASRELPPACFTPRGLLR